MKESISYSFLLNIIILFIFVCVAIIMGIFSYYKAFRANTIISETIEKYEGFNCVSKEEIARKLGGLGYNTPFNVQCKSSDKNCETDSDTNGNYKVISYNLDFEGNYIYDEDMNSTYKCEEKNGINYCTTNKHYQYGIYTYMYVELPVISNLLKLSYFSKTNPMYEFRNFYVEQTSSTNRSGATTTNTQITDTESVFDNLYTKEIIDGKVYVKDGYYGTETIVDYDEENNPITSTTVRANDVLADTALQVTAILRSGDTGKFNYEILFNHLTNNKGRNYLVRAQTINLATMNGGDFSNTLFTIIKNRGVQRNRCGFIRNYEIINKDEIESIEN